MKFDSKTYSYIKGEKFSNGKDIFFKEKSQALSRIEYITKIIYNNDNIHFGCADHIPLIDEKINQNKWLHKLILESSNSCVGIDNNKEAIDYIQSKFKIDDIYYYDITLSQKLPNKITEKKWDYIILGEIIEHTDNPVNFLKLIKTNFEKNTKKIIITSPNVFNYSTINDIKKNKENINTDHRYWFSPYTLSKIAYLSGLKNIEFSFADPINLPYRFKIYKHFQLLKKRSVMLPPYCFNTIILTADL